MKNFNRAIDSIAKKLEAMADLETRVGWFPSAVYEDGTPVASVAMIQEYGAPAAGIPPRPFIAPTINDESGNWSQKLSDGVQAIVNGKADPYQVMSAIGMLAAGNVKQHIASVNTPELSEATKKSRTRNGRNFKPLQDTGLMIASVDSVVVRKYES